MIIEVFIYVIYLLGLFSSNFNLELSRENPENNLNSSNFEINSILIPSERINFYPDENNEIEEEDSNM